MAEDEDALVFFLFFFAVGAVAAAGRFIIQGGGRGETFYNRELSWLLFCIRRFLKVSPAVDDVVVLNCRKE